MICRLLEGYMADETFTAEDEEYLTNAANMYREILLSYRVLFGQQRASWRLYRSENNGRAASGEEDLLVRLCGSNWAEEPLYDEIDAPPAKNVYSARYDFPFYGERMVELHQFVELLSPHDWRTLWYDRRDLAKFWTVWAVILFGMVATILALLGVLLAAAQVGGTFQ